MWIYKDILEHSLFWVQRCPPKVASPESLKYFGCLSHGFRQCLPKRWYSNNACVTFKLDLRYVDLSLRYNLEQKSNITVLIKHNVKQSKRTSGFQFRYKSTFLKVFIKLWYYRINLVFKTHKSIILFFADHFNLHEFILFLCFGIYDEIFKYIKNLNKSIFLILLY